ncbi:MAG: hypothetical protein Q9180_004167 [Flavoplaca navasiana]
MAVPTRGRAPTTSTSIRVIDSFGRGHRYMGFKDCVDSIVLLIEAGGGVVRGVTKRSDKIDSGTKLIRGTWWIQERAGHYAFYTKGLPKLIIFTAMAV